jgi:DNA-entry nuclease
VFTSNARVAKVNGGTVTAVGAGTCVITAKVPSGKLKCTVTVTGGVPSRASGGSTQGGYVVNTNTGKFHDPSCASVRQMSSRNKLYTTKTREELIAAGYSPCKNCNP